MTDDTSELEKKLYEWLNKRVAVIENAGNVSPAKVEADVQYIEGHIFHYAQELLRSLTPKEDLSVRRARTQARAIVTSGWERQIKLREERLTGLRSLQEGGIREAEVHPTISLLEAEIAVYRGLIKRVEHDEETDR